MVMAAQLITVTMGSVSIPPSPDAAMLWITTAMTATHALRTSATRASSANTEGGQGAVPKMKTAAHINTVTLMTTRANQHQSLPHPPAKATAPRMRTVPPLVITSISAVNGHASARR
jgi:hypothetical protein